jgi:hypothetical protein
MFMRRQPGRERPVLPRSVTTARTGCQGGLPEFVPVNKVDAAISRTPSVRSRRIRYWGSGVARAAGNACGRARSAEYKWP